VDDFSIAPAAPVPQAPAPQSSGGMDLGPQAFMKLLTTQLANQDPLEPVSNEDFIAQLAQFAGVERLVDIDQGIQGLYGGISSMNNASMSNLLGRGVVAMGDHVQLEEDGGADLRFVTGGQVASGTVRVRDDNGSIVANLDLGAWSKGEHVIAWDGLGDDGGTLEPGTYTFEIEAADETGASVPVDTLITGTVTELDYSDGVPRPSIDGVPIGLDEILRLTEGAE